MERIKLRRLDMNEELSVTWDAESDSYIIAIPGEPKVCATIAELEDLVVKIQYHLDEVAK
jgi:hypothetical protein